MFNFFKNILSPQEELETESVDLAEPEETEDVLPDYIKMYDVPGQDEISLDSYLRYRNDKKEEERIIKACRPTLSYQIRNASDESKVSIIEDALASDDVDVQIESATNIIFVPENMRNGLMDKVGPLIDKSFVTGDIVAQQKFAKILNECPDSIRVLLIEKGLVSGNLDIQRSYAEHLADAPRGNISALVKIALTINDPLVNFCCLVAIKKLPEEQRLELIVQCITNKDMPAESIYESMIMDASVEQKVSLIENGLLSINPSVQIDSASMISNAPEGDIDRLREKVASIVEAGLVSGDADRQETCAKMIGFAAPDKTEFLLKLGLQASSTKAKAYTSWQLDYASVGHSRYALEATVTSLIRESFVSCDTKKQIEYADLIPGVSKGRVYSLISKGIDSDNVEVKIRWINNIKYASDDSKMILLNQAFDIKDTQVETACLEMIRNDLPYFHGKIWGLLKERFGNRLVEPSLYNKNEISSESFSRSKFKKTGSETTLIGGELKGKTILRHLKPEAFLNWQKLYESYELWQEIGFDYVPIEPIQSFRLNKEGLVDVYSGVLDLDLASWSKLSDDFKKELEDDKWKIIKGLEKCKIKHGHGHVENYCLRFFRDKKGKVDFTKKPRLYLIDLDAAASPGLSPY